MHVPHKLKPGDLIRIITPSNSLELISEECRQTANKNLQDLGLQLSFGKHVSECDFFRSSSVASRLDDLHEAFADPNVKGILTVIGGYNCNQLLKHINYDLLAANPKIFCGFSDITALQNAIWAKTGMVTYSGPHYSTFGMKKGLEYTIDYFKRCFFQQESVVIGESSTWSNDEWYIDQENRVFEPNSGLVAIQHGKTQGTIIGGNIGTLTLLKGTEFMPSLLNSILFLEETCIAGDVTDVEFERQFQSLIHLPDFSGVRGIVIGRFEKASKMTLEKVKQIIRTKPELAGMPVVCGADFGHTTPIFTFPVGGLASLDVTQHSIQLTITIH
ncbi:MAG: LD-carboxypeptidase [Chlamydiales bacterium]|nr:LD-carboxypeptidase [Chlamydiales bacterium]